MYRNIDELIQIVIRASYKVYNTLGAGFLEKIYEKALYIELKKAGLSVERQFPLIVYYEDEKIGDYHADLFVEDCLMVELKSVETLNISHEKQLINYLSATKVDDGLLINFGIERIQIKRKFRVYKKSTKSQNEQNEQNL